MTFVRVVQRPGKRSGFVAGIVFDDRGQVDRVAPILRRIRDADELREAAQAYGWCLEILQ